MDYNKLFQSKTFKAILGGIGGIIIFLLILQLGMSIGFKKANFSYQWGEKYHQNFGGPRGGFFGDLGRKDLIDAHGVTGQIIKIESSTLVIKGRDNVEKIVLVKDNTTIERLRETIKLSDLRVDDFIVTIGEPNDAGQIEAKFIRLMPPLPTDASSGQLPPQMPKIK